MIAYFRRYWGFARCAVSSRLAYRSAILMSFLTSAISLAASLFLWNVLFQEQSVINGYTWNDMIAYAMVAFIAGATLSMSTERAISNKVLDGSIAVDLAKPIYFQDRSLFEAAGSSLVEGVIAIAVSALAAALISDLQAVATPGRVLLLALSLFLAFLVKFLIAYLAGLMCFFTSNGYGVIYLRQVITDVFSGAMLPLAFYPDWFQKLAAALPFESIVYTPTQLFLGRLTGWDAARVLAVQALWIVALWFLARWFFGFAARKITIHGG